MENEANVVLFFLCAALGLSTYVLYTLLQTYRERERLEKEAELVPFTEPGVEKIRYWVICRTGLPIRDLYRVKGHWCVKLEGNLVKVEDLFRHPKHHAQSMAEEALENHKQGLRDLCQRLYS